MGKLIGRLLPIIAAAAVVFWFGPRLLAKWEARPVIRSVSISSAHWEGGRLTISGRITKRDCTLEGPSAHSVMWLRADRVPRAHLDVTYDGSRYAMIGRPTVSDFNAWSFESVDPTDPLRETTPIVGYARYICNETPVGPLQFFNKTVGQILAEGGAR